MAEINISQKFAEIGAKLQAAGLEWHEEQVNGESLTRFTFSKKVADPKAVFQSVGANLVLNLPGSTDTYFNAGTHAIGLGNSPSSSAPSEPSSDSSN